MLISLDNISKIMGNKLLLFHVSATVNEGDRIGIVGENGAGKSTLLRVITGAEPLDEGTRGTKGNLSIGFLEQNAGVDGENTVYEEMCLGAKALLQARDSMREMEAQMETLAEHESQEAQALSNRYSAAQAYFETNGGYELDARIEMILSGVGFADLDRTLLCKALSGGEKTRLALARLLLQAPELLLLDEPTNHLDFDSVIWLEDYLRLYKGTVLIVSHDRYFLDRICTRIWEVDAAALTSYKGNYTAYMREREARFVRAWEDYENQKKEIVRLEDFIARNKARASSAAMAHSREKELARVVADGTQKPRPPFSLLPLRIAFRFELGCGMEALHVEELDVHVDANPTLPILCKGLEFTMKRDERVAIVGGNGVGKSTFLRTILPYTDPSRPPAFGPVRWGINAKVGYYAQDDAGFGIGKNKVLEEVMEHFPRTTLEDARNALACLGFRGEDVYKPVWGLSGGEKARLKLTLLMYQDANILILDEPTNHLDIPAKEAIEKALRTFEGPVLVVSHDRYFLSRVPTRVVELLPDRFVDYPEGFSQYERAKEEAFHKQEAARQALREQRRSEAAQKAALLAEENGEDPRRSGHRTKGERAKAAQEQRQKSDLERRIAELEQEKAEQNAALTDPELCRDAQRVQDCCAALEGAEKELEGLLEQWILLSD